MVSIFPAAAWTREEDLESLDLVLARFRGVQCFAIRCHIQENEEPVYLLLGPEFFDEIAEPVLQDYVIGDSVLSFGQNYRFDIDPAPNNVAFPGNSDNLSGLVIREDHGYFRFAHDPTSNIRRMNLLDLRTGAVINDFPHGETVVITRWGISIGLGAEDEPTVVIPAS